MSIPKYEEIGKRAEEILNGFFDTGDVNIKVKSKDCGNEIVFESRLDDQWRSSLGSKVDVNSGYGFQVQHKYNTDNVHFGELALCDSIFYGTRVGLTGSLQPGTGELGRAWTANIIRNSARLDIASVNEKDKSQVANNLVMKFGDFLLGYQCFGFNRQEWLKNGNICLAYMSSTMDASFTKQVGGKNFVGTVCGKGNPGYETSVKLTFDGVKTNFEYGIALKAGSGHLMAKVDSKSFVSAGMSTKLGPGITAKFWGTAAGSDPKSGGTFMERLKFSVGLECDI